MSTSKTATKGVMYRRTARFTCGHYRDFEPPPRVHTKAWCGKCADWRIVMELVEGWSVRCAGCRYARFFGVMERAAGVALGRHKDSHLTHAVSLFHNGELVKKLGNGDAELLPGLGLALDDEGSMIPF